MALDASIRDKTDARILGNYISRIAASIVKEVGTKETVYKLDDPEFMGPDFESPDAQHLKTNVETFIDRMEVLVSTLVNNKKRAAQFHNRITKLEDNIKDCFTCFSFRENQNEFEKRMLAKIDERFLVHDKRVNSLQGEVSKYRKECDTNFHTLEKDILWRIKDAEEMIKLRASTDRVDKLLDELDCKLRSKFEKDLKDTDSTLNESMSKFNNDLRLFQDKNDKNFVDVRKAFAIQDNKLSVMATREIFTDLENKYTQFKQRSSNEFEQVQAFCRELNLKVVELMSKGKPANTSSAGASGGAGGSVLVSAQLNQIGD